MPSAVRKMLEVGSWELEVETTVFSISNFKFWIFFRILNLLEIIVLVLFFQPTTSWSAHNQTVTERSNIRGH